MMLAKRGLGDGDVACVVGRALEAVPGAGRLNVAGNAIGVAGVEKLAARVRKLQVRPALRVLHLGMNAGLGDEGVRAVCDWVGQEGGIGASLEALSLAGCGVGDAGAKAVAGLLLREGKVPQLKVVDLSLNAIGDEGAIHLSEAVPALSSLLLRGNSIGNRGARVLALRLLDAPGLQRLNVEGNTFGGPVAELFETTWLDRSQGLVLPTYESHDRAAPTSAVEEGEEQEDGDDDDSDDDPDGGWVTEGSSE